MKFKVLMLVLLAHVFLNLIIMSKIMSGSSIYFLTIICWTTVAVLIIKAGKGEDNVNLFTWRFDKAIILHASIIGALQITALLFAGLLTTLGKSPYLFAPVAMAINVAYFSSTLVGLELSRACLVRLSPRKHVFSTTVLIALLYAFLSLPLTKFLTLGEPAKATKFLGSDFLPTFAQSLLATYFALLGGPTASMTYRGTLEAFEWLSPILPNPPWALKALIATLIPMTGFVVVNEAISPFKLMRLGIASRSEIVVRARKAGRSSSLSWLAIGVMGVILLWSSTGLLGFQLGVIASGSMRPTLDVGDVIVAIQVPADKVRVGDVIQYWRSGLDAPVTHRVVEVRASGGALVIITKGDANNAPDDPILVTPRQRLWKVAFTIPKVGWASIALKSALGSAVAYLTENPLLAWTLIVVAINATAYTCLRLSSSKKLGMRR